MKLIDLSSVQVPPEWRLAEEQRRRGVSTQPATSSTLGAGKGLALVAIVAVSFALGYVAGQYQSDGARVARESVEAPKTEIAVPVVQRPEWVTIPAKPDTTLTEPSSPPVPPASAITGQLFITSNPATARVTVNGIARGQTPVRVQHLPIGSYSIRFVLAGYPIQERRVTLTQEQPRLRVSATLQRLPQKASRARTGS